MTKTLTEQWREGTLPDGNYYFKIKDGTILSGCQAITDGVFRCEYADFYKRVKEVLAPVPGYDEIKRLEEKLSEAETIFKIIKRNMENPNWHKDRPLTDLEIAIKSQVCGYIERYGVK